MKCLPANRHILTALTLFLAGTLAASAQAPQAPTSSTDVPQTISYQGILSSADGSPFADGEYGITITLYGDPQGTSPIWSNVYTTLVNDGLFNLYLGDGKPLPTADAMNRPLWIGTSVNGAPEMRPLTPLAASPYAINVPDKTITGNKIADGTITAEKLNLEYIGELQVEGQKISAKGTALNIVGTPSVPLSYDQETQRLTIGKLPAAIVDREKGARAQASPLAWDSQGDLTDGTAGGQNTTAGDWIGTSSAAGNGQYDFEFRTEGEVVMLYQTSGAGSVPNIIGGQGNTISAAAVQSSIIAEGTSNTINAGDHNAISGGQNNTIAPGGGVVTGAVIGGGGDNSVDADYSAVGGGQNNTVTPNHSNIGGGQNNTVFSGNGSNIGGGLDNTVNAPEAVIAGGHNNRVESYASGITGGHDNAIYPASMFSFVGGGQMNTIGDAAGTPAEYSAIAGGQGNRIGSGVGLHHSAIGGGWDNEVTGSEAVIAGGHNNHVHSYASGVTGGHDNVINANSSFSFIGGGNNNMVAGGVPNTVIGGGRNNNANATFSTIGGGISNNANASYSTIGGGEGNITSGDYSTIPGGDMLSTTSSYAQSAMGFMNAPRGLMPVRPSSFTIGVSNDPLFMVGNGDVNAGAQSNAFEVSYNGHSTVYGVNNSGTINPAITGATYVDNVVYAWGEIDASGAINADFGVSSVATGPPGTYTITLSTTDPFGNPINLNQASITATIVDDTGNTLCAIATSSRIGVPGANSFVIRTYTVGGECMQTDLPFMFKVTGRP